MAWENLEEDIAEEFKNVSNFFEAPEKGTYKIIESTEVIKLRQQEFLHGKQERPAQPPCEGCGGMVPPCPKNTRWIPRRYCSKRCSSRTLARINAYARRLKSWKSFREKRLAKLEAERRSSNPGPVKSNS